MQLPVMQFAQPVDRSLVHKHAIAEVFVTDADICIGGESFIAGQLPRTHSYYNDLDGKPARLDAMPLLELCRQACLVLGHGAHLVPRGMPFVFRSLSAELETDWVDPEPEAPLRVVLRVPDTGRPIRYGDTTGVKWRYSVATPTGVHLGDVAMSAAWLPAERWQQIRAEARRAHGLFPTAEVPPPTASTVPAAAVGRASQRNVVIADLREHDDARLHAALNVDVSHPGLFDHPVDHLPGMVELEALRQLGLRAASRATGMPAAELSVQRVAARFTAVGELDLPTRCEAGVVERRGGETGVEVAARVLQQPAGVLAKASMEIVPGRRPPHDRRRIYAVARERSPTGVLDLSALELLTTTRAVRRRLDLKRPVPRRLVTRCVEIASQAPIRPGRSPARFVVVDEPAQRAAIASVYRRAAAEHLDERATRGSTATGNLASAAYLAEVLHRVPVLVLPCIARPAPDAGPAEVASTWASLLPACWSFMLAARLHGLGTAWTTVHLRHADEVASQLGIPADVLQGGLIPVAWSIGTSFRSAKRAPANELTCWNAWDKSEKGIEQ